MEGDSQIIIQFSTRILHGSSSTKVSTSWRLANKLKLLKQLIQNHRAINFHHVRRKANIVADLLANKGVESQNALQYSSLSQIEDNSLRRDCQNLIQKDHFSPDADDMDHTYRHRPSYARDDEDLQRRPSLEVDPHSCNNLHEVTEARHHEDTQS